MKSTSKYLCENSNTVTTTTTSITSTTSIDDDDDDDEVKAATDYTQNNSKCSLCGDRDETIYRMSGGSKLPPPKKKKKKKYKSRHDWVGKLNHWEMSKSLMF